MADRNDYMRAYMREYRAAKRAARLVETGGASGPALAIVKSGGGAPGDNIPAASSTSSTVTEPGQEITELGIYARYKWAWWLLAGLVIGYGLYLVTTSEEPRKHLTYPVLVEHLTEPINPDNQDETTSSTEDETPDNPTEPGQE